MLWPRLMVAAILAFGPGSGLQTPPPETVFTGYVTDTECGGNHAPMIAKGGMGKDDRECTLACVRKGATFGFVGEDRKKFYQLDDQDAPARFAGRKVRIRGRREGDTIFVESVEAAD